jgi:hypothetical protein
MAFESSPVLDFSYEAAEDLSDYQFHFVCIDSNGKIALMDAVSDVPIGVLQNAPESGEEAVVRHLGISRVVANGSIDEKAHIKAEFVSVTDCGKAASNTTTYTTSLGRCVAASSAEDDLISVLLTPGGVVTKALS